MSAIDAVKQLGNELLKDDVTITPKHIASLHFEEVEMGVMPDAKDPARSAILADMSLTRHALGVLIWVCAVHPSLA